MSSATAAAKEQDQSEDSLVQVLVRVRRSQREWAQARGFSLAALVRRLLDEEMRRAEAPGIEKGKP